MTDASAWVPATGGISVLAAAAAACAGCELHGPAERTVFSKGSPLARLVLLGEQPGDEEDRAGIPFVGPAGRLLDRALAEAGVDAQDCYVTNAVKHFRFTPGPRRRLHVTPELAHVVACRPWLDAELSVLDPEIIVCLGSTAVRALLGSDVRVMRDRGQLRSVPGPAGRRGPWALVTVHPSSVLRADDPPTAFAALVDDLKVAGAALPPARPEMTTQ